MQSVYDKLTKESSADIVGTIVTLIVFIAILLGALSTGGFVSFLLWFSFVLSCISIITKALGWRTVVLTVEEQNYLRKNYR